MLASPNLGQTLQDSKMNHALLPPQLQLQLMEAADTKNLQVLDAAIENVRRQAPYKFHTEASLKTRVFFNQPRGRFSGSFVRLAP